MPSFSEPQSLIPLPRPSVEKMKPYTAPLEGRRDLLRLDFNENTIGPSPLVIKALNEFDFKTISIYPEYQGLKEAFLKSLNQKYNKDLALLPCQVGLFNGVDAAINAIFHAYGEKSNEFLTTTPTFGYYKPCADMQGMKTIDIPYEGENFEFPWEKIYKAVFNRNPKIIMICNPNNPTGTQIASSKIIELAQSSPKSLVVIDELYEAFTGDSVLESINFNNIPNILVLRSLSKTAGLAGLRIGFAIGNENVIESINRVTGPYDVNSLAIAAAFAALEDQNFIDKYIEEVLEAKKWIQDQLLRTKLRHHVGGGNYLLIWPKLDTKKVESYLKTEGVLIRDMNKKDLLEGSIRVSIGTVEQMKFFWQTFEKALRANA